MAFFVTALAVVVVDQFSKVWVRTNLALGESIPDSGFFRLNHIQNSGAAFGLFQDQTFLLTIVGFVGITLILSAFFFSGRLLPLDNAKSKLALGLILGGTVGNLIDRLSLGYVTDFINIGIWPTFNAADSAVVIGTITFAYLLLTPTKNGKD